MLCSCVCTAHLLRKEMKADLGFVPTGFYPTFESKLSNHLFTHTNYKSKRFGPWNALDEDEEAENNT